MVLVVTQCPYCNGQVSHRHPVCARCTILIGPGHEEEAGKWINGRLLCADCQGKRGIRPPAIKVAMKLRKSLYDYWASSAKAEEIDFSRRLMNDMTGTVRVKLRKRL